MSIDSLEPIAPKNAVDLYLDQKGRQITTGTRDSYETSLSYFLEYCKVRGISNLNHLSGRELERYRTWRKEESYESELKPKTMRDEMYLFQDFIGYLESVEGVSEGLHKKVQIPQLRPGDGVSDKQLEGSRAKQILNHLDKFEYASLDHVYWLLLCTTGRRIGGLNSLDLGDYRPDVVNPYLAFRHRPAKGTRLKNGYQSETNVNITKEMCSVLDDYQSNKRASVTDDYGREPLLATDEGRMSTSTMRKYVYKWTRPCQVTGDCPHEREIDECNAAQVDHEASKCPSSLSPHPIRHGYISATLDAGVPKQVISERCDVSEAVIDKHYDERTESEKQNLRRRILEQVSQNGQEGYV